MAFNLGICYMEYNWFPFLKPLIISKNTFKDKWPCKEKKQQKIVYALQLNITCNIISKILD